MKQLHLTLKKLLGVIVIVALSHVAKSQINNITVVAENTQPLTPSVPITDVITPTQNNTIAVFPNPAHENLIVNSSFPMHVITIVDILGRTIKQFQPNQLQAEINLNDLLPGRYFICVKQQDSSDIMVQTFIKV